MVLLHSLIHSNGYIHFKMEATTERMDEASLQSDVDSLSRVRNRLAQSPDSALPKVLTALLPRLLVRLERNHVWLISSSSSKTVPKRKTSSHSEKNDIKNTKDSATIIATNNNNNNNSHTLNTKTQQALVEKSQTQLTGILTHALERIRVGRHTIPQGAPWIRSLLPLLQNNNNNNNKNNNNVAAWESPVATTFLLLLLQTSLPWYVECMYDEYDTQRNINKDIPSTLAEPPPEDIMFLALPALLDFVHTLHCKISEAATAILSAQATIHKSNNNSSIRNNPATATMSESLLLNYRTASWLCFDILALSWGLPALIDWDRDEFDECDWSSPCCSTAKEAFLEHGPSRRDRGDNSTDSSSVSSSWSTPQRNFLETSGSFQLWLDLLLFWPAEENSPRQQHHHRRVVRTAAEIMVENSTGMTPEGIKRLNHRCKKQGQTWNQRYLRELKLACVHSVVVEPLRSLSDNVTTVDDLVDNLPLLRALILCIVSSSTGSMHGKVALEYVGKMGLRFAVRGCRVQLASLSDPWAFGDTSLVLACCLLTLILGDDEANTALEKHPSGRSGIDAVLGQSQCTSDDGDKSPLNILKRAPMPFAIAERAIDFILTRLLPPPVIEGVPVLATHGAREAGKNDRLKLLIPVFVDLITVLSTVKGTIGSYWGIQCIDGIHSQFKASNLANKATTHGIGAIFENGDVMQVFKITCLQISSRVLSQIAQVDAETMVTLGELQQPAQNQAQPGGVPGPFGGRRDLNLMLAQHRNSQKKRQLQVDCALQARRKAYQMVADFASSITATDFPPLGCNSEEKSSPVLELPIILLKCATGEQELSMEPYISKALDSWLMVYKSFLLSFGSARFDTPDTLVAPLLPSLQCAVCSESSVARFTAAKWVAEIIFLVDPDIARHVCTFLADDDDFNIAGVAKKALALIKTNHDVSMDEVPQTGQIDFFDLSKANDMAGIKLDLESRVKCVSASLSTSLNVSRVLLGDFKFEVATTVESFLNDRPATLERCGLVNRSQQMIAGTNGSEGVAGQAITNCGICYDEVAQDEMYEMACRHPFCLPCWYAYVRSGLDERPSVATTVFSMTCPEQDCNERITKEDVHIVALDILKRLDDIELQAFLAGSKNYSSCPGPDCKAVAQMVLTSNEKGFQPNATVQCPQHHPPYCFACSGHPHQPAKCDAFAEWNRIFGSSQFWVKKNAKPCPGCKAPIEKNNGCNHIRCSLCRHDFCWLCLGHLRTHMEPHICNRYEPHQSAEDDEERRALFFTDRYKAHDDAEVFARNEVTTFEEKLEKLSTETLWFASDDDLESMLFAAKTLVRSRNFLKNSYVAAWAMRNDVKHRSAFDSHQANLELFTEKLSQLLLTKVHQLNTEQGARAIHMHFRAIQFSTASLEQYMGRITKFINSS